MAVMKSTINEYKQIGACFFGVFFCYLLFGICQEKITRGDYDGETFTYAQALVFIQCIFSLTAAKLVVKFVTKPKEDTTPATLYASCAFCYTGAMVASNVALQYISYPAQVLGKACKPIPVMILGIFLAKKRYPPAKFACILMIVVGVAMFMYKDSKAGAVGSSFTLGTGELLLLLSLTLDGLTGVTQEKMRSNHFTDQHHMMYNVNLWSCYILATALIVTGQGLQFIYFCTRHPEVLKYLLAFCITSALGQHFIFLTVVTFGPLACSVITTTRKFFTILCSVIFFQNPLSNRQCLGTSLVFLGLACDAKFGKSKKPAIVPKEKVEH